jgi:spore germination protein PF
MHMLLFIGAYKVVSNTGTINNGDSLIIAPTISTKTHEGSGSSVIGDLSTTISFISATITNDSDIVDSSPTKIATLA